MNNFHKFIHKKITLNNRIKVLSKRISELVGTGSILDVGTGSGDIAIEILKLNDKINLKGIDVLVRENTKITVEKYDGIHFPAGDDSVDLVMFIDVLHHTPDPFTLLKEASRVAKKHIIIKDHNCNNLFQRKVLSFTDWFGNAQYGVNLELNFQSKKQWDEYFSALNLKVVEYEYIKLYPWFTRVIFWKSMDFIVKLAVAE